MNAVINFEYLIAPVLSKDVYFDTVVDNLRLLSELLSSGVYVAYLEKDILSKMRSHGYFPSDRVFQNKISKLTEGTVFCSADIVRIVNIILSNAEELEEKHLVEWEVEPIIDSSFNVISKGRESDLNKLYCSMAVDGFFNQTPLIPVYFHPDDPGLFQKISFKGVIKYVFPSCRHVLPLEFHSCLNIMANIDNVFGEMDGYELYKHAETELEYKFAFYVGTVRLIKEGSLSNGISWDEFKIGENFITSLKENQGHQNQPYSSVVYDTIINLLADTGQVNVNKFNTDATGGTQRVCKGFSAYRVHITKSGRALRLLFWKDDYEFILSNIGNKNELRIYEP
ncbi:hypothetical protein [Pectobacterium aroidearum]|uniref:hypothetical protein n=1 Tax=Pectobacterium aroidearum TaxID=1201031 RepID=UPI001C69F5FB|nr:hypothetical protein [Pectobacterium aroidearum]